MSKCLLWGKRFSMENVYSKKDIEQLNIAEKTKEQSERLGIFYCTIEDKNYPNALKEIPNRPVVLYYRGEIEILNTHKNIAVVGSRNCSPKGKELAYKTGRLLAGEGMVIVNGLALGCDMEALRGALEVSGKCAVVMPCGLDNIQPRSNRGLAQNIIDMGGCVLSEYPVGTSLAKYQYVERDRLQSGVSQGVVIVEAEKKSGTMHTAEFAVRQYKRLACYYHKLLEMSSGNQYLEESGRAVNIRNEKEALAFARELPQVESYQQMSLF